MVAKSARLLAPMALAAVAVGVYLILHAGLVTHDRKIVHSSTTVLPGQPRAARKRARTPKFYVVRSGDTLSSIAVKNHISEPRILSLNSQLSPNSLQTGQRLRLRR
jgi:LysM repeat protein